MEYKTAKRLTAITIVLLALSVVFMIINWII